MTEIKRYSVLNELAEKGGTVIFGGKDDQEIPLCELRQAFELESKFYNRSFENLTITKVYELYKSCVAPLKPDTVLLHIGENDLALFNESPDKFISIYRELIGEIKSDNKKCRIAIVSLKNYEGDIIKARLNEQLKYLADSERCEFADIAERKVWNPIATKDAVSFVYLLGVKVHKPIYDLAKILFCYGF